MAEETIRGGRQVFLAVHGNTLRQKGTSVGQHRTQTLTLFYMANHPLRPTADGHQGAHFFQLRE
jgi:hypothetical protein